MRILGIERDQTACNHYRVLQPLMKLRQHKMADALTIPDYELGTERSLEKLLEADIVVFQRPADNNWFDFIRLCQKHGKIIVCDYDDDPYNTHPLNPYYKYVGVQEFYFKWPSGEVDPVWVNGENGFDIENNIVRRDMFKSSYKASDMITTTTDILASQFKRWNSNVSVLPNLVDFYYYKRYDMVKKNIRIGFQGGASHYEDLYMIKEVIKRVLKENDNVTFVYLGDLRFKRLFQDIPTSRIEYQDWVQHIAYPYKLALANLDIGICPLIDNVFNRNKSCLKYLDYSAIGAATVASNIPPYSPVIRDGETGYLAGTDDEWVDKLNKLIRDRTQLKKMSDSAYEFVYENYNADKKAHLWLDAYQSLIKKDIREEIKEEVLT